MDIKHYNATSLKQQEIIELQEQIKQMQMEFDVLKETLNLLKKILRHIMKSEKMIVLWKHIRQYNAYKGKIIPELSLGKIGKVYCHDKYCWINAVKRR